MWDIIGHRETVRALESALAAENFPHALILAGPDGVGKTTVALEVAKRLNCIGAEPPCGECVHCRQIVAASHPDVSLIERPEGKENIAIAQVRVLREAASLRPFQGRWKVYIIAGAESLTPQAADALLKTLEEPQPQVILILTTTDSNALPATVRSRCRAVLMHPVLEDDVREALEHRGVDRADAKRIARLARGNVGWALGAGKSPRPALQRREMLERLGGVLDMSQEERLSLIEAITGDRKDRTAVRRQVELLLLLARDLLLMKGGLQPRTALDEQLHALQHQAERYSLTEIGAYVKSIRTAMVRIDANVDPRLALEAALASVP